MRLQGGIGCNLGMSLIGCNLARLNGIQRALANRPSTFLINLENELLKELEVVLNQEEEIWVLKSRVNWLVQGDRSTNFYHVSTLVRRKQN